MAKQWFKSDYEGVRYRKHPTRRCGVHHDRYFTVYYKLDGKTKTEGIGWGSKGHKARDIFEELLELKRNQKAGKKPRTFKEKREMAERSGRKEEARNITLDQYWPSYLQYAERSKKPQSWSKEEGHYKHWLSPTLGKIKLRELKLDQWDLLVEALTKAELAQRTIEYVTGTLRRILKHAYDRRIIDEAPPSGKRIGVKGPGNSNRRLRVISPAEGETILKRLADIDPPGERITRFAFLTGCRASEAFNLCWRDIESGRGVITFPETKNRDSRNIPISEPLAELLSTLEEKDADQHVFIMRSGVPYLESPYTFRQVVKELKLNEGQPDRNRMSFHSIRHSVATKLARDLNLRDLMDVMGWRTVQMAMRYVHGNEKAKRNALAGLESTMKPKDQAKVIDIKKRSER
jgi:integrase